MTAVNTSEPQQRPSKVVPMTTRPAQPVPTASKTSPPGTVSTVESHPADEPGYGHGV